MNLRLATVGLALDQVLINSSDRRDAKFRDRETRDGLGWRGTQMNAPSRVTMCWPIFKFKG